jgi:uncharacterized membrane protein YgaE (UPF0421/DUF939 family)
MTLLVVLIILAFFGAITGAIASTRGHNFLAFFLLGALISPLLGIILCFIITPPKKSTRNFRKRYSKTGSIATRSRSLQDDRNPYSAPRSTYSSRR